MENAETAAMLGAAISLQNLEDDMVKLVGYSIVSLEYGAERILNEGSGSVIITERMSADAFVAYILTDYFRKQEREAKQGDSASAPDTPAKLASMEPGSLDVHFVVMRRWLRRAPKFDERKVEALSGIHKALLGEVSPEEDYS